MGYYETYESKYICYTIFLILLHVYVVQFGIIFYMHTEIDFIYRK
jgi:hypothetical protein